MAETAAWITYRPELKVLDCTIRDGGLINDHVRGRLREGRVRRLRGGRHRLHGGRLQGVDEAVPRDKFGAWKFCDEDDLRRVVGDNPTPLKLAAMADAGKSDWQHRHPAAKDSVLDMIRVAFYAHQVSEAVDMIKDAARQGLRGVGQPDGRLDRRRRRNRSGAGGDRANAGQHAGGRRQLRLDVRRAGRVCW